MNLAIENFVSEYSPLGSANNSCCHCAVGPSSLWSLDAYNHQLWTSYQTYTQLPQVNDTENVREEMLFSFESETCYVLHIFPPLCLMRIIEASSETLLLMQQGAWVSCQKLVSAGWWAHGITCAMLIPNSTRLSPLSTEDIQGIFNGYFFSFFNCNCLQETVCYDDFTLKEKKKAL